ncbi:polysaccharide deacetylase family protein [Paenibacillus hexagrammi]|uniref:Polysaccharide deacetylase family protein n=1 Tax=Paenibacillus hexagrammi TaxID=2908839 RepID=A0ABY3SH46_9BACL|nr:polysaccharide deacetylase family protein [Paenibacillus sp. YPD9-1]UJF32526.1 polysaccharide deacetylase family protein [Paenibacillus sp. YPD9-1]
MSEKLLIINADDFGMCHATNQAISTLLFEGAITSTSIMMPCPWVSEAVALVRQNPHWDVGIHITHTSEWSNYKWGPLNRKLSTLMNECGYFPAKTEEVAAAADPEELYAEAVAQIEMALRLGIEPTNIDNHMGSMNHVPELLLKLCQTYRLPLRYPKQPHPAMPRSHNKQLVEQAEEMGILLPDDVMFLPFFSTETGEELTYEATKATLLRCLQQLRAGITELLFHPSLDTEELQAITDTWKLRRFEFDVFRDPEIADCIANEGINLITWRELRNMQRV